MPSPIEQAEILLQQYEPLDLYSSLDVCHYLGEQNDDIIFKGTATTPSKLLGNMFTGYHPRAVSIRFWGGPPTRGAWHDGTFYTYLIDRIARIVAEHGFTTAKRALRHGIAWAKRT